MVARGSLRLCASCASQSGTQLLPSTCVCGVCVCVWCVSCLCVSCVCVCVFVCACVYIL